MKYFNYVQEKHKIFLKPPSEYNLNSDRDTLNHSLGAVLYMSGLRKDLLNDILKNKLLGSNTVVICLEDSVDSLNLSAAENNVIQLFNEISKQTEKNNSFITDMLPLLFIRVRSVEQFEKFLSLINTKGLCGFIFPKVTSKNVDDYFSLLKEYNHNNNCTLYGMPILESSEIIFKENQFSELLALKSILDSYKNITLNIRIGGTDLSGIYGLRRDKNFTIYDIGIIKDCICTIINIFKRDDYIISGPVYEYFEYHSNLDKDTFVREVSLDITNGLLGKTVIHPSQVNIANSLLTVSKESYLDAKSILQSCSDGVIRSLYSNKMNEVKPHFKWALNISKRAKIMGVLNDGKCYKDILKCSNELSYRSSNKNIIRYKRKQI